MQIQLAFVQTRRSIRRTETWLNLNPITDKQMIATLRLINILVNIAVSFNQKIIALLCFRAIELSLAHGMSEVLPPMVALYGIFVGRRGFSLTESGMIIIS